jgi:hypothetical protein
MSINTDYSLVFILLSEQIACFQIQFSNPVSNSKYINRLVIILIKYVIELLDKTKLSS